MTEIPEQTQLVQPPLRTRLKSIINSAVSGIREYWQPEDAAKAQEYLESLGLTWEDLLGKRVLDLGAGNAGFAHAAKKQGINVISIDRERNWFGNFGTKYYKEVPYVEADAFDLPFDDGDFDVVLAKDSIDWIVRSKKDMDKVVAEVKRVLSEGGEFRFNPRQLGAEDFGNLPTMTRVSTATEETITLMPSAVQNRERLMDWFTTSYKGFDIRCFEAPQKPNRVDNLYFIFRKLEK